MLQFAVCTLGCKVNYYESNAISEKLVAGGLRECSFDGFADIYIINTCAVTGESERKAGQMIRRARRFNPEAYIIVTGCFAQLAPERVLEDGADYVCGNGKKLLAADAALSFAADSGKNKKSPDSDRSFLLYDNRFEDMTVTRSERTRAYIKVADGCDGRCAYCIIRKARGPVRSKPVAAVISEARALIAHGYREIVLTAIELSAYGRDLEDGCLAGLINGVGALPGLERLRLGSLDPAALTPAFVDAVKDCKTLASHFHLSLQSGCDKTLRAMRRRYNTQTVLRGVELLKSAFPDVMLTADIITGFPGETEEDFEISKKFIASLGLLFAHIFTFSPRPGTEAAEMEGQLDESVKNSRSAELQRVRLSSAAACFEACYGKRLPVLFESFKDGVATGHTASFIEISVSSNEDLHGRTLDVIPETHREYTVFGRLAE